MTLYSFETLLNLLKYRYFFFPFWKATDTLHWCQLRELQFFPPSLLSGTIFKLCSIYTSLLSVNSGHTLFFFIQTKKYFVYFVLFWRFFLQLMHGLGWHLRFSMSQTYLKPILVLTFLFQFWFVLTRCSWSSAVFLLQCIWMT